jgi:hypothetical protein
MDPSRAVRSDVELGTNCTSDGAEGTEGAGDENSIKPVNINIKKMKHLISCMIYTIHNHNACFL